MKPSERSGSRNMMAAPSRMKAAMDESIESLDKEKRVNSINQVRLLLIGAVFITLWFVTAVFLGGFWLEILSIIGSFVIWEASNIWIVENPKIKIRCKVSTSLRDAETVFVYE